MLPHVVRYNGCEPGAAAGYRELAQAGGLVGSDCPAAEAVERLAVRLEELLALGEAPAGLAAAGVREGAAAALAEEAARQWTAAFNPRAVDAAAFVDLYRRAGAA